MSVSDSSSSPPQVGAIGDAYMVICGAPDQVKTHAERVANVSLGMLLATQDVSSPFKYHNGFKGVQVSDYVIKTVK